MKLNVGKEVAALKRMSVGELRTKFADVFGETTNARNKDWLVRRIAWRIQVQAEGDISERARERAKELAIDADLRSSRPKETTPAAATSPTTYVKTAALSATGDNRLPLPGATITRDYKGQKIEVRVLPRGFEHEGEVYKSLSAVAKKVTGAHCNGYFFFRLGGQGSAK
jgi:hypothetical protein